MRVACCCTLLALCGALLVQGTPLPAAKADAAQSEATREEDVDGQVSATIQEAEKQQNDESPREKRAGAGGSFLNDLNQGPTYSQLLGQSGGGFNKLGILSGLLGSSSGGGAAGGGDAAGASGSGSGSILSLITPLLGSSSGPNVASLVDLGLLGLNLGLPGGDGASPLPGDPPPAAGADEAGSPDLEDAGSEDDVIAVTAQNLIEDSSSGGGAGASAGASVSLGGSLDGGDIGASVGASIDGDTSGGAGAGAAGAGAGSDSGSILSLVTPLLGSSSQGSGGDGTASGGGNPATAGTFGGGFLGTILSAVFSIKSFIFRKIVQLLTSSSGSPQAG